MSRLCIELPLPREHCHPNSRSFHWSKKHKAMKASRQEAAFIFRQAMKERQEFKPPPIWPLPQATVQAVFYLKRKQDGDNLNAWLKPYIDALQDAGLVVNDSEVKLLPPILRTGKDVCPRVVIRIEPR